MRLTIKGGLQSRAANNRVNTVTAACLVFLNDTQFLTISFEWLHVFIQPVEQCSAINNLSIASALQLSKSGLCNLKHCVTLGNMQKFFSLI